MRKQARLEVAGPLTDEDPSSGIREFCGILPGILQGFPAVSSNKRCCGSRTSASRGEIPKNAGVEFLDAFEDNLRRFTDIFPGTCGIGIKIAWQCRCDRRVFRQWRYCRRKGMPKTTQHRRRFQEIGNRCQRGQYRVGPFLELRLSCRSHDGYHLTTEPELATGKLKVRRASVRSLHLSACFFWSCQRFRRSSAYNCNGHP